MELGKTIAQHGVKSTAPIDSLVAGLQGLDRQAQAVNKVVAEDPPAWRPPSPARTRANWFFGAAVVFALVAAAGATAVGGALLLVPALPLLGVAILVRQHAREDDDQAQYLADNDPARARLREQLGQQAALRRLSVGRLKATADVLRLLAPDASHLAPFTLELSLDPEPAQTQRINNRQESWSWHTLKHARWLTASGTLADGSRFTLTLADHEERVERGRMKRKGRKIKSTVSEAGLQARVALKPRRGRYPGLEAALGQPPGHPLPAGLVARPVAAKGALVRVVVLAKAGSGTQAKDAVAAAFFSLYDRLGAAQPPGETP
jgi:hypothetical protein